MPPADRSDVGDGVAAGATRKQKGLRNEALFVFDCIRGTRPSGRKSLVGDIWQRIDMV
jgi:hypothetical protein